MNEIELVRSKIYEYRGQRVMLDSDLAELYGVTTGNFNKAVKRNIERFPDDFMFQLNDEEYSNLKFQIGIASSLWRSSHKPICIHRTRCSDVVKCIEKRSCNTSKHQHNESLCHGASSIDTAFE